MCEAVWLKRMLSNMKMPQIEPSPLFCDIEGVLKLAKNLVFHKSTKHVELHCHFIGQLVEDGFVMLWYCPIEYQIVDMLTKSLEPDKFVKFWDKLGVVSRLTIRGGW